jgi:hypothetical protein
MLLKKSVLFAGALLFFMAVLLVFNMMPVQTAASATPCTAPMPKCCIPKYCIPQNTEEHNPQQPVTNFIIQI